MRTRYSLLSKDATRRFANYVRLQTQERDFCLSVNNPMNTRDMHRNAEHCLNRASETSDTTQRIRFIRAAKAWRSLAAAKSQLDAALFMDEDQYQMSKAA